MKKIVVLAVLVVLAMATAAMAGEFFSQTEMPKICQAAAKLMPCVKIQYSDTCTGGGGILIGPLPDGKFLFMYANARGEIFIYQPPVEYEGFAREILAAVKDILDNRPASDATKLGRNLLD